MKHTSQPTERGAIAIFFASTLGLLLLVSTTSAARLMVSDISQSSQVDRSEAAYYAAEAGVEDALSVIDNPTNTNKKICEMFPKQFSTNDCTPSAIQYGDYAIMTNADGTFPASYAPTLDNTPGNAAADNAQLAWRTRKVYGSETDLFGIQQKDESIQVDASDLRRHTCEDKPPGTDCNGTTSIFNSFYGPEYCWTPVGGAPEPSIEFTAISWPDDKKTLDPSALPIASITTEKGMISPGGLETLQTGKIEQDSGQLPAGYDTNHCLVFKVNSSRRYIFRIKPIFANPIAQSNNQAAFAVNYRVVLKDDLSTSLFATRGSLYMPNDTFYIDVVGQSGDIRRRIIAKKLHNGRLLGVFDYILYSGSPTVPLCKAGITQIDAGYNADCTVFSANNSPTK